MIGIQSHQLRGGEEASPTLFLDHQIVVLKLVCICVVVLLVMGGSAYTQVEDSLISRPFLLSFPSLAVMTESWVGAWEQG